MQLSYISVKPLWASRRTPSPAVFFFFFCLFLVFFMFVVIDTALTKVTFISAAQGCCLPVGPVDANQCMGWCCIQDGLDFIKTVLQVLTRPTPGVTNFFIFHFFSDTLWAPYFGMGWIGRFVVNRWSLTYTVVSWNNKCPHINNAHDTITSAMHFPNRYHSYFNSHALKTL